MANSLLKIPLGDVSADQTSFPSGFLVISDDADVSIECHMPGFRLNLSLSLNNNTAAVTALTHDGWGLSAPLCYGANSAADATATVVSFTPMEVTVSQPDSDPETWDVKELWLNGPAKLASGAWTVGGYDFELVRARDESGRKVAKVSLLRIRRNGASADFEQVKRGALALLSLASRTHCSWFCERTFTGGSLVEIRAIPGAPLRGATHPLIPYTKLGDFMSMCA